MKKKKYLLLYNEWIKKGEIPNKSKNGYNGGLCAIFGRDKNFDLFIPTIEELEYRKLFGFWGLDDSCDIPCVDYFSPLRQNIVLFMAAMNNEL